MSIVLDTYTVRARLLPSLLVALPFGLATLAWFPNDLEGLNALWSLFVWSGGSFLMAQIGRDWGKKKELKLFESWGGKPTIRMLRHRDAQNKVILERRHKKLQEKLPELKIPTIDEEKSNPPFADDIYESCITFLRERSRDRKKFPLVFEENCNYGFRRNLWGMKPLGIMTSIIGIAVVGVMLGLNLSEKGIFPSAVGIVCGFGNLSLLLGWLLLFTPNWVRIPGEAYAERLLESLDTL